MAINELLNEQGVPEERKRAIIVLVRKGNMDPMLSESFKLLCMIDTFGKLTGKIERNLDERGGLSERQFGFMG